MKFQYKICDSGGGTLFNSPFEHETAPEAYDAGVDDAPKRFPARHGMDILVFSQDGKVVDLEHEDDEDEPKKKNKR